MNHATPSPPAAPRSRRDFLLAPVTGLAFLSSPPSSPSSAPNSGETGKRYLLVGEDTELKVYDAASETLCCQIAVFSTQPIHGISVSEPRSDHDGAAVPTILVWGNQSAAVLSSTIIEERLRFPARAQWPEPRVASVTAPDWIHDGLVTPDGTRSFLVTAHNQVHEVTYDGKLNKLSLGLILSPPARPALYCAKLASVSLSSPSDLLVACGTVFGEILVWKCSFASSNHSTNHGEIPPPPTSEVLFVFTGHEGSVYGVDLSPEISFPDGRTARLLASCSDDRTVRIWDVSESSRKQVVRDDFYAARETGFGSSVDLASVGDKESGPVAVGMGHASRIWHVKFGAPDPRSIDSGDLTLPVYSFGEDATTWKWKLHVDGAKWRERAAGVEGFSHAGDVATLSHVGDFAHHDGKHISAAAIVQQDGDNTLIATGGSDGKVNLLRDSTPTTHLAKAEAGGTQALPKDAQRVVLQNLINRLSVPDKEYAKLPKNRKETFQQFAFIGPDTILAASNVGRLLLGDFDQAGLAWKEIDSSDIDPRELAFSTVIRCPAPGVAVIGTTARKLFLYRDSSVREIATISGKVTDILCLNPSSSYLTHDQDDDNNASSTRSSTIELLVSLIGGTEPMRGFSVDATTGAVASSFAVPEQEQHYKATSASLLSNEVLAVGSRFGHLTLFKRSGGQLSRLAEVERRAPDAITSIVPLPDQQSSSLLYGRFYFLTTCRDAYYRVWEVVAGPENAIRVRLRHETSSAVLPSIEGAWFTAPRSGSSSYTRTQGSATRSDLILTGFRGRRFVVYNETQRREVANVDCGGGHRLYDYEPLSATDADRMRFAFIKTSDLWLHHQREASHATVKTGTHGREIRAVAINGSWIATGSEDTTIRIWDYRDGESAVERSVVCKADVKAHRAGLQVLKWHQTKQLSGNKVLFSCSGNEEFCVWRVRKLRGVDSSSAGLAILKEAELLDKTPEGDLRIMDFDVSAVDDGGTVNVDGEGVDDDDDGFSCIISMAFSNSTFKTYLYSTARGFHLLAKGQYTGACVTQIRHLKVDGGLSSFEVLTAASDGHLTVWTTPKEPESTPCAAALLDNTSPEPTEFAALLVTRLHQSNVKALDLGPIPRLCDSTQGWLILTGGDDNALGMGFLSRDEASGKYEIKAKAGVKSAHAAAINGLTILPERRRNLLVGAPHDPNRKKVKPLLHGQVSFATVSNDQRLKTWRLQWQRAYSEDGEEVGAKGKDEQIQIQIALVADRNSGVADPGDLDILEVEDDQDRRSSRVMVVGVGMEVWRLRF